MRTAGGAKYFALKDRLRREAASRFERILETAEAAGENLFRDMILNKQFRFFAGYNMLIKALPNAARNRFPSIPRDRRTAFSKSDQNYK